MGVSLEGTILGQELLDILNVETLWVVDCRVIFDDSGDLAAILVDEVRGPVSDSTESLNNECLVLNAERETSLLTE
jgi:hypothetical protein